MNRTNLRSFLKTFLSPILLALVGLILLIVPDLAAVLVSNLLAWGLIAAGLAFLVSILVLRSYSSVFAWLRVAGCMGLGGMLLGNPLALARMAGMLMGLLLLVLGISAYQDAFTNFEKVLAIITVVLGVVLVLAPMSLSRIVLRIIGLVMVAVGAADIFDRIYRRRHLDPGDPNIIDADE